MLQRYKFFSKYYSDIPKIHHDLLAVYDIDTLHGRGQARDSVPVPSVIRTRKKVFSIFASSATEKGLSEKSNRNNTPRVNSIRSI